MAKNNEPTKRVQVEIYNDNYYIRGNCDEKHIQRVAAYLDQKMHYIAQRNPRLSLKQIAMLTSINITDELLKLQNDYDNLVKVLEEGKKG